MKRIEEARKAAWCTTIRRKGRTGLLQVQSLSKQTKEGSKSEVFVEQTGTQHGGLTLYQLPIPVPLMGIINLH